MNGWYSLRGRAISGMNVKMIAPIIGPMKRLLPPTITYMSTYTEYTKPNVDGVMVLMY